MPPTLYLDLPPSSHKSNGIRCLYELALELVSEGIEVIGVPRHPDQVREALQQALPAMTTLPQGQFTPATQQTCSSALKRCPCRSSKMPANGACALPSGRWLPSVCLLERNTP